MIESKDISVIVQGAIDPKLTPLCLQSVRTYLPGAEIILSTWAGSTVDGLDCDTLVLNRDPGGKKCGFIHHTTNNTNRQLVSTQGGLQKASRPYCLKVRSDALLKGAGFLSYWDRFPARDAEYALLEHKILVGSVYSREATCSGGTGAPTPFHPSDLWLMGLTQDMRAYFSDTALMPDLDLANWAYKYPNRVPYQSPLWRYAPEQYYLVSFLKRHPDIALTFEEWSDWNEENISLSQKIIYNNFVFLGFHQSSIYNRKHAWMHNFDDQTRGLISYDVFQKRYQELCDPDYQLDPVHRNRLHFRKHKREIREAARVFIAPVRAVVTWGRSGIKIVLHSIQYGRLFLIARRKNTTLK